MFNREKAEEVIETPVEEVVTSEVIDETTEEIETPEEGQTIVEETQEEPFMGEVYKKYMGKNIISESTREVNGKEYIYIRLEDGTTHDLTEDDYKLQVTE